MQVTLRPNRRDEAPVLFDLWSGAVAATHQFLKPEDLDKIARIVRDDYLPFAAGLIVAAAGENDRPVGFMELDGDHIDALFVENSCRRQGIGRRLVAHARALHPFLTVDVNEQNEGAVAFYRRLGFRRTGRSPTDSEGRPYPLLHLEIGRLAGDSRG